MPPGAAGAGRDPRARQRHYVRQAEGRWTRRRWACIWITQIVYFGLPWLSWNDRPAVLFDLPRRRLYLFDWVLWPQDLIHVAGAVISAVLLLLVLASLVGRLWCGHACPHSVYGELFLWIERRIEGGRSVRMQRDAAAPSFPWALRKLAKHAAWLMLALAIGITFAAYFTPSSELLVTLATAEPGPWQMLAIGAYGGLAYLNAGWMRSTFCRSICAWSRLQSAVCSPHTLLVGYDAVRGEPRGPYRRRGAMARAEPGDCVDCTLCIQVCPAGLDIRDGLDHACIDCGACIDACDGVMEKLGRARGLIRYAAGTGPAAACAATPRR